LTSNAPFRGGKPGKHRVIVQIVDKGSEARFCGLITHEGIPGSDDEDGDDAFVQCFEE